jgi:hypothetical protein
MEHHRLGAKAGGFFRHPRKLSRLRAASTPHSFKKKIAVPHRNDQNFAAMPALILTLHFQPNHGETFGQTKKHVVLIDRTFCRGAESWNVGMADPYLHVTHRYDAA